MHIMLAFQKPSSQEHINGDQISRSGSAKKCVPASRRPCTGDVVLKPRVVRRQLMVVVHSHTDRVPVAKVLRQIKVLALFIAGLILIGFGEAKGDGYGLRYLGGTLSGHCRFGKKRVSSLSVRQRLASGEGRKGAQLPDLTEI